MNVLRWCPFVYLFDTPFQNSPYGHELKEQNQNHTLVGVTTSILHRLNSK